MKTTANNPKGNSLGPGIKEEKLAKAIASSGYPLQSLIADYLRKNCTVQEEWSFIDRDTKEMRALDIAASKPLYDIKTPEKHPRIRPTLNLLIECKQSEMPYVFFLGNRKRYQLPHFPIIAGLAQDKVSIKTDDDRSTWTLPLLHVLSLNTEDFMKNPPHVSHTFSRCARRGSDLELSGTEAFHGLVLPLIKAQAHFKNTEAPPKTAIYFDCHLAIAVAVIDAPMVTVETGAAEQQLLMTPWIRVMRHESYEEEEWTKRSQLLAMDVVHKDFFPEYFEKHVMSFADIFATRALKHQKVIAEGKAFVKGMGADSFSNLEERLQDE
jgi:hypothetical protein